MPRSPEPGPGGLSEPSSRLAPGPPAIPAPRQQPLDRDVLVQPPPVDPNGLISNASRAAASAFASRGNQASGAPITRPSDRPTHIVSPSNRTVSAEILTPDHLDQRLRKDHAGGPLPRGSKLRPNG